METTMQSWVSAIRKNARRHLQWKICVQQIQSRFKEKYRRQFALRECEQALEQLLDILERQSEVQESGDVVTSKNNRTNPFDSIISLDSAGKIEKIKIDDARDWQLLHESLFIFAEAYFQHPRLNRHWRDVSENPSKANLPLIIFFAFFSPAPVAKAARELLRLLDQYNAIQQINSISHGDTERFIVALKKKLFIKVEPIIDLLILSDEWSSASRWFSFCRRENIDLEHVPSLLHTHSLQIELHEPDDQTLRLLQKFRSLKSLRLYSYSSEEFPLSAAAISGLETLEIMGRLQTIEDGIARYKTLQTLTAADLKLQRVSPKVFELRQLRELVLRGNELTLLPEFEARNTSALKHLDLSYNLMSSFPFSIQHLKQLEHLNLANNLFRYFPRETRKLKNLKLLNLSNNKIQTMPNWLSELESLEELYCSLNLITNVESKLKSLTNLRILDLRFNPISGDELLYVQSQLPNTRILHQFFGA